MEPVLLCYAGIEGRPVCELYSSGALDMVEDAPQILEEKGLTLENFVDKRRDDILNECVYLTIFPRFQPRDEDEMALKNAAFQLALYLNVKYSNLREFLEYRLNFVGMTKTEFSRELDYTRSAISKWLKRETISAKGKRFEKLAELLDVPVNFLRLYRRFRPERLSFEEIKSLPTLGDRLRAVRMGKGLYLGEAGEIFSVSGALIGKHENNKLVRRSGLCVLDFAEGYGVPVDVLAPLDESELPEDVHGCIKYGREQLFMSQRRLAKEAGINHTTVIRIEAGYPYKDYTLEKIIGVLFEDYPHIIKERFRVKVVRGLDFEEIKGLPTLGRRLRAIRESKGLFQRVACKIFDRSKRTLGEYENDKFLKSQGFFGLSVLDFAEGYGVPVSILAPLDESELPEDVRSCIKYRRRQLRLSQIKLAKEAGTHPSTINSIETGKPYKESNLEKIVLVLFKDYPEIAEKRFGVIL